MFIFVRFILKSTSKTSLRNSRYLPQAHLRSLYVDLDFKQRTYHFQFASGSVFIFTER